jgi:hypothetical protein
VAREYTLSVEVTNPTAVTSLQVVAGSAMPITIIGVMVEARAITGTAGNTGINLIRKSAAATVTAAVRGTHIFKDDPGDANDSLQLGTAFTGHTATAEGTDTDTTRRFGFHTSNGLDRPLTRAERVTVPAGGIAGLKWPSAPPAGTYHISMKIAEGVSD